MLAYYSKIKMCSLVIYLKICFFLLLELRFNYMFIFNVEAITNMLCRKGTCLSKSTFDWVLGVRNTCSITGSVSTADLPNPVLSVGTERHPITECPRDSATWQQKHKTFKKKCHEYKTNTPVTMVNLIAKQLHTCESECQLQLQHDNNNVMKSSWTQASMHEINF